MAGYKRKALDFDPNKSDSDDEDFDVGEVSSSRPRLPKSRKSKSATQKPAKRRKETYGDSEDDIEVDSDDTSDDESLVESGKISAAVELNPRTGRSVRLVAKKPVKYEDESDAEIEADESEPEVVRPTPARSKRGAVARKKDTLIVALKVPVSMEGGRAMRQRAGSKGVAKRDSTPMAHGAMGTRRSSRISHDEQQPLVALTDSGKHEDVVRPGTATPEPPLTRPTRATKGLKKPPSAIMEASQEDSGPRADQAGQDLGAAGDAAPDTQVERTSPEGDAEEEKEDEIRMETVDEEEQVVQESMDENEEEDEGPVSRAGRSSRPRRKASTPPTSQPTRATKRSLRSKPGGVEQHSDFEPDAEGEADVEENVSSSDDQLRVPRGGGSNDDSQGGRRSARLSRKATSQRSRSRRHGTDDEADEELDADEVADEAADLEEDSRRNKRPRKRQATHSGIAFEPNLRKRTDRPDYRVIRPELLLQQDDDDVVAAPFATPQRNKRTGGGGYQRSLFSTYGPFGGAGGPPPIFGAHEATAAGATGGVDSDSSDDEMGGKGGQQHGLGGTVGMTPTSAFPKPYVAPQLHGSDPIHGPGGGPPALGKVKDRKLLADADPLGVDTSVNFEGVGGLDDHINQLKEMVGIPLLYPEIFQRFHVTPPRGVLFHGPPGTGKTLLARALASSVSTQGKKVTFYMRKGADALSKWVGEAEKQLRLLFEEARRNQPSIIFFDEIDGLAPVRSSKQEQIHASIVATLLALMDGMDGRGQVIVIGATNRPDSVDPALRRPGRFDREFYFPLPDVKARRAILDIHTKGWDPPLEPAFKDELAVLTRGYGGADLRALCTEAALNAVQGTYPQIYSSDAKLVIDPSTIKVLAKDFMISVKKIVPSSERSATSGAAPLKKDVESLLRQPLVEITRRVDEAVPRKRKATALEEAVYDDREDELGFERETMAQEFESARVYRPRLLILGEPGMGQQYLGAALLSKFEGLHVQNFDMPTLMKDSTRSPEAAVVQLFEEVKRHKPSVIYLPNVDIWYRTLGESTIKTFSGLLRSLPPTDPVLVLGIMDRLPDPKHDDGVDKAMLADLFPYSSDNQYMLMRPTNPARLEYFESIVDFIRKAPADFPEPENRKRRKMIDLPIAPVEIEVPREPSKVELKLQKKHDRHTLNMLKLYIQGVMDQIKNKYKKFRFPIVDDATIRYLYDEQNPQMLSTDLGEEERRQQQLFRPYELDKDEKGADGLREVASGKFYYNLEIVTIEKRLSNGYYKRPKDFYRDIKRLARDAHTSGDQDRTLRANEMLANVEVDMFTLEMQQPALVAECDAVYERELERERLRVQKVRETERRGEEVPRIASNVPPPGFSKTTTESSGPVVLGQLVPGRPPLLPFTPSRLSGPSPWSMTNGSHPSHQTNGSTVPSKPHEDSEMLDSQPENVEQQVPPEQPRLYSITTPSNPNTQGQRSQKSVVTHVAQGSQLEQYHNSASTTTSGPKTSSKDRSSGPFSINTNGSNGVRPGGSHPDYHTHGPAVSGSQLPDTQEMPGSSQISVSASQPSQQHMAPPAAPPPQNLRQSSITSILNNPAPGGSDNNNNNISKPAEEPPAPAVPLQSPPSRINLDEKVLAALHEELVENTSGMSVEQLEQINAELMKVVWLTRGNWNRNIVLWEVQQKFNETVKDIELCQRILDPSQPKN